MHRFALGLLIILTVTGCNQDDGTAVSADDVAMVKGPDGTTQYMPVTHDAATSGYAQWLQLRADLAAIGSTGDFLDTQVGNLHLQRILLQRAQARHWKWAKLHGSGVVDLIAAQKTVQTRISQLDPNR
jgi:hypothetical protein